MSDRQQLRDRHGRFRSHYDAGLKVRVRIDYESSELILPEIAQKHDVTGAAIRYWAHAENWKMRLPRRIDPNDLLGRMLNLLDVQIADLETVMKNGATEVVMLSRLVTTLDRVLALKARSATPDKKPSTRIATLRAKIANRLAELNRA
jgi:hypothetical protein